MKVGTDGVLLGAWVDMSHSKSILDLGSGTGLVGLMCAQRNSDAQITGIEINEKAAQQAELNFKNSKWSDRLKMCFGEAQKWSLESTASFDHIISNPPFFRQEMEYDSLSRAQARTRSFLNPDGIFGISTRMGALNHCLSVIFPYSDKDEWLDHGASLGYVARRICSVRPNHKKPYHRAMIEFGKVAKTTEETELVLELSRHVYTEECKTLTAAFYLNQ